MEITKKDYDILVGTIEYVITRQGNEIDATMVELLREELSKVTLRVENENYGSQEAREIDVLLGILVPDADDESEK